MSAELVSPLASKPASKKPTKSVRFPVSYLIVLIGLIAGFYYRQFDWISAEEGLGYWLGIVGGIMMLMLLLYPIRKRFTRLRFMGSVRFWFRLHMLFGLFGPLLILYHSNFGLGSINSQVAMFCMLVVAGSGMIGRHLYAHIHHGLYGGRATLRELQTELQSSQSDVNPRGAGAVHPSRLSDFAQSLQQLTTDLLEEAPGTPVRYGRSLLWMFYRPFLRERLKNRAYREIAALDLPARERRKFKKSVRMYLDQQFYKMRKVAQFQFYEKLFVLWHILHLPLFFMLILSAIAHVVAVHMY